MSSEKYWREVGRGGGGVVVGGWRNRDPSTWGTVKKSRGGVGVGG